jgi:hypothetical protein
VTYTAEDIARVTGEHPRNVRRWLLDTLGPTPRGHARRVTAAELARLLAVTEESVVGSLESPTCAASP